MPKNAIKDVVVIVGGLVVGGVGLALLSPFFKGREINLGTIKGTESPKLSTPAVAILRDRDYKEIDRVDFVLEPPPSKRSIMPFFVIGRDGFEYFIEKDPEEGQSRANYLKAGKHGEDQDIYRYP